MLDEVVDRLRRYTRANRSKAFRQFLSSFSRPLRIIDLGGTVRFWEGWGVKPEDQLQITLINNHHVDTTNLGYENRHSFIHDVKADALHLEESYLRSFDIIFSNSFIEHLSSWSDQKKLADCIVGSDIPYFIQTPNKYSPLDPHFPRPYVPYFAIYPRGLQAKLLTISRLGSGGRADSFESALRHLGFYNPLGQTEMRRLFPKAEIRKERPFGVPMSILTYCRKIPAD